MSPTSTAAPFKSRKSHWIPLALKTNGCSHLPSSPILDVNHPLGIGVAEVGAMRWPVVDLGMSEQRNEAGQGLSPGFCVGMGILTMVSSMG